MEITCCAPVTTTRAIGYRSSGSSDPRCQRSPKEVFSGPFGPRCFCRQHADIWRDHYAIIERIRTIPGRDIE